MTTKYVQEARLLGAGDKSKRRAEDFYVTPIAAIDALLKRETFSGKGWEPAAGDGRIAKAFGMEFASDIRSEAYGETVDFRLETRQVDYIVTNPPYSLALPFVKHALECAPKVAMFLRLQFLEGQERREFFEKHPPIRIYVFSERLNCDPGSNGKGGMMCFAWFVWERDYHGCPALSWL